jgi:hypothetical protein
MRHRPRTQGLEYDTAATCKVARIGPAVAKRLEESLETAPERIVSKAGRARALQRVPVLEQFLRDLRAESADLRSL